MSSQQTQGNKESKQKYPDSLVQLFMQHVSQTDHMVFVELPKV